MKFSCYLNDRTSWILEIAQDWLKNQKSTDINVICVDNEKATNYQCHKLLISSFFEKELPMFLIDESEEIILTDDFSRQFQFFYKSFFELNTIEEAKKSLLEQDPPNENNLENFETKQIKLTEIKEEISGLEEDLYDFNDDEDYDYDTVDEDVEIEKVYDIKKEHDKKIIEEENLIQNDENWASNKEDEEKNEEAESEKSFLKKERKEKVKEIKKQEKAKAKKGRKMKVSKDKKKRKGKDIVIKEKSQNLETKSKKVKKESSLNKVETCTVCEKPLTIDNKFEGKR